MVVLSAAVCNDEGKVLVSRQFVSMTRLRIEGLLSAFPKLLGNDNAADVKQHTFVETDEVRYVYQPMDSLYVLLVTNKTSNIIKDLKTLRLLAKLVPEYCEGGHDEEAVNENSFELIFAFDEAVSLGHGEGVDIGQIKTYTTMDSHEEKLTRIIQESKKTEAIELAKKRAREIAEDKKKMASLGSHQAFGGSNSGYGGDYNSGGNSGGFGSYGGGTGNNNDHNSNRRSESPEPVVEKKKKKKKGKGFSLKPGGKNKKKKGVFDDLIADEMKTMGPSVNAVIKNSAVEEANYESPEPVKIKLEEKCSILCERDGALKKFDVAGSLTLTITDPTFSKIQIEYNPNDSSNIQYRAFPKIDKSLFKKNILALKDPSQGFPVGSNSKQAILKWKLRSTDEKYLPLTVSFWSSEDGDSTVISMEYNAENNVDFMIAEYFEHIEECQWAVEACLDYDFVTAANMCIGPEGDLHGNTAGDCGLKMYESGAKIIGLNCHFDPFVLLKGMEKIKVALENNGIVVNKDVYLMVQPLAYMTPDASKQGFIDLPEFPFGLEPRICTRYDMQNFAREAWDMGVRYIGGCCGFQAYHIRACAEELTAERGGRPHEGGKKWEPNAGGLLMHTKPWVRARASDAYWKKLDLGTGRPTSHAFSRPDAWGVTQGDEELKQQKFRE